MYFAHCVLSHCFCFFFLFLFLFFCEPHVLNWSRGRPGVCILATTKFRVHLSFPHAITRYLQASLKMISVNTFRSLHKLLHPHVSVHSGIPPVLTGGLLVFMALFCATTYILPSPLESLSLSAATVKNFEPNRLTWYPLIHYNIFHLILCSYLLYPMLAAFEKFNGTVRTAIVLNALATVAGVMYILSQLAMFSDSSVIGSR